MLKQLLSEEDFLSIGNKLRDVAETISEYNDVQIANHISMKPLGELLQELSSNK